MEKLLTRNETAKILRLQPNTLAVWLCVGRGPELPVLKIGGRRFYRQSDVEKLINAPPANGTGK